MLLGEKGLDIDRWSWCKGFFEGMFSIIRRSSDQTKEDLEGDTYCREVSDVFQHQACS